MEGQNGEIVNHSLAIFFYFLATMHRLLRQPVQLKEAVAIEYFS